MCLAGSDHRCVVYIKNIKMQAGKDQGPVDFNRDWCPLGQVATNVTGAACQHWAAIRSTVQKIKDAMASGIYDTLIFVDSHSPGNPTDPAQVGGV